MPNAFETASRKEAIETAARAEALVMLSDVAANIHSEAQPAFSSRLEIREQDPLNTENPFVRSIADHAMEVRRCTVSPLEPGDCPH